jgi:hypothetical protein
MTPQELSGQTTPSPQGQGVWVRMDGAVPSLAFSLMIYSKHIYTCPDDGPVLGMGICVNVLANTVVYF